MPDSKVVIKIKTDNTSTRSPVGEKMVTVWHIHRIVAAVAVLLMLIGLPIWLSSGDDAAQDQKAPEVSSVSIQSPVADSGNPINQAAEHETNGGSPSGSTTETPRPAAIILDKKVIRASLNSSLKAGEPDVRPKLPIQLHAGETLELYYFTEVKNLAGNSLQHLWFYQGRQVAKKVMAVKGKLFKAVSSHQLSAKDKGDWQIRLVNQKGRVLSEVNFQVIG